MFAMLPAFSPVIPVVQAVAVVSSGRRSCRRLLGAFRRFGRSPCLRQLRPPASPLKDLLSQAAPAPQLVLSKTSLSITEGRWGYYEVKAGIPARRRRHRYGQRHFRR